MSKKTKRCDAEQKSDFMVVTICRSFFHQPDDPIQEVWVLPAEKPCLLNQNDDVQDAVEDLYSHQWFGESDLNSCFAGLKDDEDIVWLEQESGLRTRQFTDDEKRMIAEDKQCLEHLLFVVCKGQMLQKPPHSTSLSFHTKHLQVVCGN